MFNRRSLESHFIPILSKHQINSIGGRFIIVSIFAKEFPIRKAQLVRQSVRELPPSFLWRNGSLLLGTPVILILPRQGKE